MKSNSKNILFPFNPITTGLVIILSLCFINVLGQKKPNILWITIEDTSPQFIGCYGNKNARTPVIDKLAQEGVRFTHAFSTGTVCSPSRSTIITGVHTFKMGTGNHRSNYPIPGFIKGFPFYMQQQGYYVSNNSKTDYNVGHVKQFTEEAWNESSNQAGWWNRQPGQAFFSVFNFEESHQSRTMTYPYPWYLNNVFNQLDENTPLAAYATMIKKLGNEHQIPVVDVYAQFKKLKQQGATISDYMSQGNHPNELGHRIVLKEIVEELFNE